MEGSPKYSIAMIWKIFISSSLFPLKLIPTDFEA